MYEKLEKRQALLRFAGKAMQALIQNKHNFDLIKDKTKIARESFSMAESMLTEYEARYSKKTKSYTKEDGWIDF